LYQLILEFVARMVAENHHMGIHCGPNHQPVNGYSGITLISTKELLALRLCF
jgi:hypothetical protein